MALPHCKWEGPSPFSPLPNLMALSHPYPLSSPLVRQPSTLSDLFLSSPNLLLSFTHHQSPLPLPFVSCVSRLSISCPYLISYSVSPPPQHTHTHTHTHCATDLTLKGFLPMPHSFWTLDVGNKTHSNPLSWPQNGGPYPVKAIYIISRGLRRRKCLHPPLLSTPFRGQHLKLRRERMSRTMTRTFQCHRIRMLCLLQHSW